MFHILFRFVLDYAAKVIRHPRSFQTSGCPLYEMHGWMYELLAKRKKAAELYAQLPLYEGDVLSLPEDHPRNK